MPLVPASPASRSPVEIPVQAAAEARAIVGSVRAEAMDGLPIPDAWVCAVASADSNRESPIRPRCTRSDAHGSFTLPVASSGRHTVHVSAKGYYHIVNGIGAGRPIEVEVGEGDAHIVVVLSRGGLVARGSVSDVFGGAVEGAWVQCVSPASLSCAALTNDLGEFELGIFQKNANVRVSAEGYAPQTLKISASSATNAIMLEPGVSLRGTVHEEKSNQPVPGASVTLTNLEVGSSFSVTVSSDEDGTWHASGLIPGRYRPEASASAPSIYYGRVEESVVLRPGESLEDIVIRVAPTTVLTGKLIANSSKEPLVDAHISLVDSNGRRVSEARTDAGGGVTFFNLMPGSYQVDLRAVGFIRPDPPYTVTVAPEDKREITRVWTVDIGAAVAGIAVDRENAPVSDAMIYLANVDGSEQKADQTSSDGAFEIAGLLGGVYSLSGRHKALSADDQTVEVARNGRSERVTLRFFRGGVVKGSVSTVDGQPISGATVSIYASRTQEAKTVATEADGTFETSGLSPDRYRLTAGIPGSGLNRSRKTAPESTSEIEIGSGGAREVHLKLRMKLGSLRGRVLDAQGESVADSVVVLHGQAGEVERRTLTDRAGAFQFDSILEGAYEVSAYIDGVGQVTERAASLERELVLKVESYGKICGDVRVNGEVPTNFRVRLNASDGSVRHEEEFAGNQGHWCIGQVQAGHYSVLAYASGTSGEQSASIVQDETTRLQFALE